jgi:hypothetical protein
MRIELTTRRCGAEESTKKVEPTYGFADRLRVIREATPYFHLFPEEKPVLNT